MKQDVKTIAKVKDATKKPEVEASPPPPAAARAATDSGERWEAKPDETSWARQQAAGYKEYAPSLEEYVAAGYKAEHYPKEFAEQRAASAGPRDIFGRPVSASSIFGYKPGFRVIN